MTNTIKTNITPGKWKTFGEHASHIGSDTRNYIADVPCSNGMAEAEWQANKLAIAAVPMDLVGFDGADLLDSAIDKAKQALIKAGVELTSETVGRDTWYRWTP
jgi:hypothetical protein